MHKNSTMKAIKSNQEVMDGSDIMELVENDKVFTNFLDHNFQKLDADRDGKLSISNPPDVGAALCLPPHATSSHSEHIYSQVLKEFTNDDQEELRKTQYKEVLSDILLGMAAGLKRDPVLILRLDGHDLHEFINRPSFEPELLSLFSEIHLPEGSLKDSIIKAFEKLSVDQGVPPATDPWVLYNILEPAFELLGDSLHEPVSQEAFLGEFKRAAENVARLLKERPVIVAHSQNTFNGSGTRRLLSNAFELEKALDCALKSVPRDDNGNISKECLNFALDNLAASAGLPPLGSVDQMDSMIAEALRMFDANTVGEDEFKKLLTEVMGSMMLQLEGNPVSISINSVVHEPLASSSALLNPHP